MEYMLIFSPLTKQDRPGMKEQCLKEKRKAIPIAQTNDLNGDDNNIKAIMPKFTCDVVDNCALWPNQKSCS